eukprot:m.20103 g.20103  ORF g.20103 m.20103 type:complete len:62 (-) comp10999_c0_seq3:1290-1475(-)
MGGLKALPKTQHPFEKTLEKQFLTIGLKVHRHGSMVGRFCNSSSGSGFCQSALLVGDNWCI